MTGRTLATRNFLKECCIQSTYVSMDMLTGSHTFVKRPRAPLLVPVVNALD